MLETCARTVLLLASALLAGATITSSIAGENQFKGVLTPPGSVQKVLLLDRDLPQDLVQPGVKVRELPAEFDAKTGAFSVRGVEPGKAYCLYVELKDGTKIEGVDLRPMISDETPFPEYGRKSIETHIYDMKSFYNESRILELAGNGKSAAVLVELCRTSSFNSDKGDAIWRIERWDYACEYGAWKPETKTRVLRRFRMPGADHPKIHWYFVSAWSDLRAGGEVRKFELPDLKVTPGRYPGVPKGAKTPDAPVTKKKHEESLKSEQDPDLKPPGK